MTTRPLAIADELADLARRYADPATPRNERPRISVREQNLHIELGDLGYWVDDDFTLRPCSGKTQVVWTGRIAL